MSNRICTKCGEEKSLSEFYVTSGKYVNARCKPCVRVATKACRLAKPEQYAATAKKWAAANPERVRERCRIYREKHKDRRKESCQRWYQANKEYACAQSREWRLANKDRLCEREYQKRRAKYAWIDALKDVPCADCNTKFPPSAMDFDHRDPAAKSFTISSHLNKSRDEIEAEIAKCDIVCANCHRVRTSEWARLKREERRRRTVEVREGRSDQTG